jgi:hypothetical protein
LIVGISPICGNQAGKNADGRFVKRLAGCRLEGCLKVPGWSVGRLRKRRREDEYDSQV